MSHRPEEPPVGGSLDSARGAVRTLTDASDPEVLPLTIEHWPAVRRIYAAGIATGHATFEEHPPTWEAFDDGRLASQRWIAA
ncbi:MAG: hypothetical protein ACRCYQ_13945, partial [Nocardioides sp.]